MVTGATGSFNAGAKCSADIDLFATPSPPVPSQPPTSHTRPELLLAATMQWTSSHTHEIGKAMRKDEGWCMCCLPDVTFSKFRHTSRSPLCVSSLAWLVSPPLSMFFVSSPRRPLKCRSTVRVAAEYFDKCSLALPNYVMHVRRGRCYWRLRACWRSEEKSRRSAENVDNREQTSRRTETKA